MSIQSRVEYHRYHFVFYQCYYLEVENYENSPYLYNKIILADIRFIFYYAFQ